jgi:hypothetical protein
VVDWITIDLKARWRIFEYAVKSQVTKNQELLWKLLQAALGARPAVHGARTRLPLALAYGLFARRKCVCARAARVWPAGLVCC